MDLAFFWNVGHHIRDRDGYFRGLGRMLQAGGRVAVVDFQYLLVYERWPGQPTG